MKYFSKANLIPQNMLRAGVFETSFKDIRHYWKTYLWPERTSEIEEVSYIDISGEINMDLEISAPVFLKAVDKTRDNLVVGVVSGHMAGVEKFRSRGIWVRKEYQRKGVGRQLIYELEQRASFAGAKMMWTMPRQSSISFYEKNGFYRRSEISKYEYGPHYIAFKKINR